MLQKFLLRVRALPRLALLVLVMATGLGVLPHAAWASHIRAGDIQAKPDTTANPVPRRIFFKMILYTDNTSPVKQPTATIFFGDGTSSCFDGVPRVGVERPIPGSPDTSLNIYLFEHTFPSTGSYVVSFIGENRNRGVLNMDRSDDQSFYISTTITLDPAIRNNRSPVLTAPAIDKAGVGQVFLHNPAAFDADGDSLAFRLRESQRVATAIQDVVGAPCVGSGTNRPNNTIVPNFRYPNDPSISGNRPVQVEYDGVPVGREGADAIFVQDVNTGQITWNAPNTVGLYNVAMVVEEWRRTPLGRRKIGEVIRDIQIIVAGTPNIRPTITIPEDICVIAGQNVPGAVSAVDGASPSNPQTPISLFAYSGIIPPATFRQTASGPPRAEGVFNWQTECKDVAELPYLVVFKAQDNPPGPITGTNVPLIDEKTWRITVIGPAPQSLRATPVIGSGTDRNRVQLNWNLYQCANASRIFIYRKLNPSSWSPDDCETRIPASAGYTLVGSVAATETSFLDRNADANGNVRGLDRGQTYCYRIYAEFPLPKGGASIASQEACATFPGTPARLIKVDVENTGVTNGQIQVCWTQPRQANGGTLGGTPSYVLSRGEGLTPTAFTPIATITSLADTCYTDAGINTEALQYTYKLEFVRTFPPSDNQAPIREVAPTASSVRVSAVPANPEASAITVSWTYNVPWDNTTRPAVIFRRTGNTGPFVRLNTAPTTPTGGIYLDNDPVLRKGQTYCYYVQTDGLYPDVSYLNSLINRSQVQCMVLMSPPCIPLLTLESTNCDSLAALPEFPRPNERYTNRLSWTLSALPTGCDTNIASYLLYYRPTPTGPFTLLATTTQTSYTHRDLEFNGGCYAVQAVAPGGVVSDTSNIACQDNCVFFRLPNIFTPNGDGQNEVFRPKNHSPVRRIRYQAFNRWGVKVFENVTTSDDRILINWDGGGPVGESGNGNSPKVSDGIYYYLAEVEFADFANTKRTYKGWVEVRR
ncbi:gliding motility-associated C-terminal domain-containing protein [Hymenobacter sp. BT683]|uniref:Gliding motility-associated C-terminal domain-containing protein n=1 Tax=Hymenobacter jeongseonensis TaxID=2791027 RepID=A0ABS0IM07_9BACT|nr:gliding motility-associated C-terminal domain-containing protein [Hymenobacter jeongseonensis]MBF9239376.1 gliding motility-associated C-terminal domain-containing protein [Hymenobacter jeongseonensis]